MARKLSETYHQVNRKNDAQLADVGQQFYKLFDTQEFYAPDGIHPNKLGSG